MQRYRFVIMLVLFGVLPVVAAFFVALSFLEEQEVEPPPVETAPVAEEPPPPEPSEPAKVLAAARALPVGALLGKDDLTTIELDLAVIGLAADEEELFVLDDDDDDETIGALRGYAVREALVEGAPITRSAVVGPGEKGFLAAVLEPGARAVAVRVVPATIRAGLVNQGDRVDVILSAELAADGGERRMLTRTIAEDLRVIAIDRPKGRDDQAEFPTATLEVSREQGDRLVLGEYEGTLSLAVRSLAPAQAPDDAPANEAVDLREMLLSSSELSASEIRRRRAQELEDLSVRIQLVESREELRAALGEDASTPQAVRIFRGSEPAEEVVFKRR